MNFMYLGIEFCSDTLRVADIVVFGNGIYHEKINSPGSAD